MEAQKSDVICPRPHSFERNLVHQTLKLRLLPIILFVRGKNNLRVIRGEKKSARYYVQHWYIHTMPFGTMYLLTRSKK